MGWNEAIENTRASYRPELITTLFVGESAPISGDFFYLGKNAMLTYVQKAVEAALGTSDDFLASFKAYGWYLDDLVLSPVNQMKGSERLIACRQAEASLAERIREYQPQAIVSLLKVIGGNVERAATLAGSTAPRYSVAFPGMGQQGVFMKGMATIVPQLPRILQTSPRQARAILPN